VKFKPSLPTITEDTCKAIILILLPIAVYLQDLISLISEALTNDLAQHILVVPFIVAYIVYRKRNVLKAKMNFPKKDSRRILDYEEICGMLLLLASFLLYFHAFYTPYSLEYHVASLILFISGLTLLLFNYKTLRELAIPLLFIALLYPPPVDIAAGLGAAMAAFSSAAAVMLVNLFHISATLTEIYGATAIITNGPGGTSTFMLGIQCSGIYSLIGYLVAAIFLSYLMKGPVWKKAAIFALSIPFIYSLNILRIALILVIGYFYGQSLAVNIFHIFGGWALITIGIFTILILSEKIGKMQVALSSKPIPDCSYCNPSREKDYINCINCGKVLNIPHMASPTRKVIAKLLFINLIIILFIVAQSPALMITKGPIKINIASAAGVQNAYNILPQISDWEAVFVRRDTAFEKISHQDASLVYAYIPKGATRPLVWVGIEIAASVSNLHRWEVCLTWPGSRYDLLRLTDIQLSQSPLVSGRIVEYSQKVANVQGIVVYWFERIPFLTDTGWQFKYVKTSLETFPQDWRETNLTNSFQSIESTLITFGTTIIHNWEPLKYLSFLSILAYWGNTVTAVSLIIIASMAVFQFARTQNEKRINFKLYNRITVNEEKTALQSAYLASSNTEPTTSEIAILYEHLAKKPISVNKLDSILTAAEESGVVTQDIINKNEQPVMVWKPKIAFHESSMQRKLNALTNLAKAPFSKLMKT